MKDPPNSSSQTKLPKNWPKSLVYSSKQAIMLSPSLKREFLGICQTINLPNIQLVIPCSKAIIKQITDSSHPSYPACGLFALKRIKKGEYVLPYIGQLHHESTLSTTSDYTLHMHTQFSIDAEFYGNEARFINDYRGVCPKPNVEFVLVKIDGVLGMAVRSLSDIEKGTELALSYGKGFWKERGLMNDKFNI